ncbi:MAG: hypothetical protein FD183_1365 [Chitinophagaceae bacterium]|nr:MAG: hypothetical protein FD183_1365 [Chitinophagaceae bacterium]
MEINRHNYENFFLLWVDDELCAKDQEAVERFIAENPDLAEELVILQEAKLPKDELIAFPNKLALLKNESESIALHNYETFFLLYVDGELNKTEQAEVELFVLQHPQLQAEFLLIQQTKLPQEEMVFENKAILYRKEKTVRPVVYMQWRRMAVAAALIGLAFSVWMIVPTPSINKSEALASLVKPAQKLSNNNASAANGSKTNRGNIDASQANGSNAQTTAGLVASKMSGTNAEKVNRVNTVEQNATVNNLPQQNNNETVAISNNDINTISTNTNNQQIETVASNNNALNATVDKTTISPVADTEIEQADLIKPAVYKELDTDESSRSLYVGSLEINKDKLRGFFRKAGSLLRSKSKEEEKIDTNK